jgi:hypothetical protein
MPPLGTDEAPASVYGTQPVPARGAHVRPGDARLALRLVKELRGEVLFDAASRGRHGLARGR